MPEGFAFHSVYTGTAKKSPVVAKLLITAPVDSIAYVQRRLDTLAAYVIMCWCLCSSSLPSAICTVQKR